MMKSNKVLPFVPLPPTSPRPQMNARARQYKVIEQKSKKFGIKKVLKKMEKANTIIQFVEFCAAVAIIL